MKIPKKTRRAGRGGGAPVNTNTLEHLQKTYSLPSCIPDYIAEDPTLQPKGAFEKSFLGLIQDSPKKIPQTRRIIGVTNTLAQPRLESLKDEELEKKLNSKKKIFQKNNEDTMKINFFGNIPTNLSSIAKNYNKSEKLVDLVKNTSAILKEEQEKEEKKTHKKHKMD